MLLQMTREIFNFGAANLWDFCLMGLLFGFCLWSSISAQDHKESFIHIYSIRSVILSIKFRSLISLELTIEGKIFLVNHQPHSFPLICGAVFILCRVPMYTQRSSYLFFLLFIYTSVLELEPSFVKLYNYVLCHIWYSKSIYFLLFKTLIEFVDFEPLFFYILILESIG